MSATLDIFSHIDDSVCTLLNKQLKEKSVRESTVKAITDWLSFKARKKPVADLQARLLSMESRVRHMVENMQFEFVDSKLVIKTAGSDETTLNMFKLGTSWFNSNADMMATILSGVLKR